ncbi:hypothetical protein C0995_003670, partial [Termitomyces sp. Mi166
MASLPANSPAILMSEKEFQETLERGDGPDQPIVIGRKAVKQPDKAHLPKKTRVERVGLESLECQLNSSREGEDLMTDEVEEQPQSATSMIETTDTIQSFWDQPVPPPDMQWAYDPRMPPEWNEVLASMVVNNWAGLCRPTGEWSTESTVSKPPVRLRTEDTGEAHLCALREQFKPVVQLHQKRMNKGKVKTQGLSDDDILQLRQAWQQEFVDIVNGTKEELPPWRE